MIHGIGEQLPGETLLKFTAGVIGEQVQLRSKPDHMSTTYELRRLTARQPGCCCPGS